MLRILLLLLLVRSTSCASLSEQQRGELVFSGSRKHLQKLLHPSVRVAFTATERAYFPNFNIAVLAANASDSLIKQIHLHRGLSNNRETTLQPAAYRYRQRASWALERIIRNGRLSLAGVPHPLRLGWRYRYDNAVADAPIRIQLLDSGVDFLHPEFRQRHLELRTEHDYTGKSTRNSFTPICSRMTADRKQRLHLSSGSSLAGYDKSETTLVTGRTRPE
ncbi:hypothetical protein PYCC9005_002369 [Savitreella phatthalungensis]